MKHLLVLVLSALTASVVFAQPYTADRHLARKVPCQACHVTGDTSVPVRKQNCLACHQSYEVVAQKTKDLKPNPHFNLNFSGLLTLKSVTPTLTLAF